MPEELKKALLELGEEIYSAGKERGKKIIANAMLQVANKDEQPPLFAEEKKGKKGVILPLTPATKKRLREIAKPKREPLAMDPAFVEENFGDLPERNVDRQALEKFLNITKTEYDDAEIDALEGGECVGIHEGKRLIYKKV